MREVQRVQGSNHFGRAYQDELLRTAGVWDQRELEARKQKQSQSQEQGLMRRLLGRLLRRREAVQPASQGLVREQNSYFSG
jgi:hypothetical protein